MDTLPLPQYPDCPACRENFDFPCFATPCLQCGEWFHNGCVDNHNCDVNENDSDDDEHASVKDFEDKDNNVAFLAEETQKVFCSPMRLI